MTSLIGLAALGAGVHLLVTASETGLAIVIAATGAMWLAATVRHGLQAKPGAPLAPIPR